MEIKKAFQKLSEPQKYGPTVVGGVAGVFGGVWALDYLKGYIATVAPGNDMADWLGKGAFTTAMVMGMLTVTPKRAGDTLGTALQTFFLCAAVTGGVVIAIKAFGWTPLSIGRVGATPAGLARTRVQVVNRPQTPTYAQAMPQHQMVGSGIPQEAADAIGGY